MLISIKEGLPWITDYYILKNKRYILTNSAESENKVHLWSMDTGKVIKTWKQKTFQQVAKIINEFDLDTTKHDGKPQVPYSWFTCDIKLGVRFYCRINI